MPEDSFKKNSSKKPAPASDNPDILIGVVIVLLLITSAAPLLLIQSVREAVILERLVNFFFSALPALIAVSVFISLVLILGIAYCVVQLNRLMSEIKEKIYSKESSQPGVFRKNEKWERVLKHIDSENPNDWRLAILEADVMLENLVEKMGYQGDTLGEKMKVIEKSDFNTIDYAWEAHKVRNMIAHQGADFMLSQREARKVIRLYQAVFEEFKYT